MSAKVDANSLNEAKTAAQSANLKLQAMKRKAMAAKTLAKQTKAALKNAKHKAKATKKAAKEAKALLKQAEEAQAQANKKVEKLLNHAAKDQPKDKETSAKKGKKSKSTKKTKAFNTDKPIMLPKDKSDTKQAATSQAS